MGVCSLLGISDGMGGQVAGEVASFSVVNEFVESFTSSNSRNLPLKLNMAIDRANRALAKSVSINPKLKGMGATLIAAQIDGRGVSWISVGDSILYLYRDKKLQRLNDDHSMMPVLQDSVRRGRMTYEEARVHPHRNALRSALTGEDISIVDLREEPFRLRKGDLIVLATDGILTLSEPDIAFILGMNKDKSTSVIVEQLLGAVAQVNKPRQDNTLVEVIKVSSGSRTPFKWTDLVSAILIFVITAGLTFLAWEKRDAISQLFAMDVKQEAPVSMAPEQKVTPIIVDDTSVAVDKKISPPVTIGQIPVVVSTPSAEIESSIAGKNVKSVTEKKATGSKAVLKVDVSTKTVTSEGSFHPSVGKSITSESSGEVSAAAVTPAKDDFKGDGERIKQGVEASKLPKGKVDPD